MPDSRSILVFLPNWVGDVVMAGPILRRLREGRPEANIVYVGRPVALALLDGTNGCDEMIRDESKQSPRWKHAIRLLRQLRKVRPDEAILFPNSFRAAAFACLSGAKRRIGYARDGRSRLLTDRLSPSRDETGAFRPVPMIDYYAKLLQPLELSLTNRTMELPLSADDQARADALLHDVGYESNRPMVMLNPGAAFGTSKLWPTVSYAQAADTLVERHDAQIIINAAPNPAEQTLAANVVEAMRRQSLLHFAQRKNTLGLLKGLLRRCDLLITNDTGARHIGAAMGTSVVTIFGSTDPVWAQIDYPRERLVRIDVPCSPCQRKTCLHPPGAKHLQCLTGVSVESVLSAAEALLVERRRGGRS